MVDPDQSELTIRIDLFLLSYMLRYRAKFKSETLATGRFSSVFWQLAFSTFVPGRNRCEITVQSSDTNIRK